MNIGVQKRKATNVPPVDWPIKHSNTKGPNMNQACPSVDTEEAMEPTPKMNIRIVDQGSVFSW